MHVTGTDLGAAARICEGAPASAVTACAQSLGLMVTNPTWQASLAPDASIAQMLLRATLSRSDRK